MVVTAAAKRGNQKSVAQKNMAWEERKGRRYYYRKVRKGGRVFSVYEGGIGGTLAEQGDAQAKQTRKRETRTLRAELARQDAIDAKIDEAWRDAEQVAREALEAAGYHRHKRQWRLKRDAKAS
jgi:hypothetical protein